MDSRIFPLFPFNFGISEGNLVGTGGHFIPFAMLSLVNFLKYGRFKEARNRILVLFAIDKQF